MESSYRRRLLLSSVALGFLACAAIAQDVPLTNWTVPPYFSSGGLSPMTDYTPPRAFVAVAPCRVVDTRNAAGPYGGPALATNAVRTFDIDSGPCPGLPAGIDAYSLSFGAILPPADGFLTAWPTGTAQPLFSQVNLIAGEVVANAAIVPAGSNGAINVLVNIGPTHVYIDINGYFADTLGTASNALLLVNDNPGSYTAAFGNLSSANASSGVLGTAGPGFPRPGYLNAGVRGESLLTGVRGVARLHAVAGALVNEAGNETAFGLLGFKVNTADPAIFGFDVGVFGQTNSTAAQAASVVGYSATGSGAVTGVRGVIGSLSVGAAGVRGQDGGGQVPLETWPGTYSSAGVRGESHGGFGVLGLSDNNCGVAAYNTSGTAVFSACGGGNGLTVSGDFFVTGSKDFIEPHPTDASKLIRYTTLEGNEPGTYFRGRGKFQNGIAVIEVPEDFRIVTDPEGLSIQVTPIGQMATVAVGSIRLDRIVVRGSRNVEFFYTVNGIRRAFKDQPVIIDNQEILLPRSPDDRIPSWVPRVLRERMTSNGTYNADGTVNMETARRLGWDKIWEARSLPAPQQDEP